MANPIKPATRDDSYIGAKKPEYPHNKKFNHLDLCEPPEREQSGNRSIERRSGDNAEQRLFKFIKEAHFVPKRVQAVDRQSLAGRAYVISDIAGISAKIASAADFIYPDIGAGIESTALSCSSLLNIGTGAATVLFARDQYKTAIKTNNAVLKRLSEIQVITGSSELVYGIAATGKNLIGAIGYEGLVSSSKASFTAISVLGHIGTAGATVRYGAHFCSALYYFYHASKTYTALSSAKTEDEAFAYLQSELELTGEDYQDALLKYERVKDPISFEDLKWITPEDVAFVSSNLSEEKGRLKLMKEIINRRIGKEKSLSIKTSPSIVLRIKTFKTGDDKASIVEEAKKESFWKALSKIAFVFLCIAGMTATILGDIFTAGVFKYVLFAIGSYISTHWLYLDLKMVSDGMKTGDAGKYDRLFKWVINLLVLAVSAVAIVYTGGLPLILIGLACSILILSTNCAIWYKSEQEKKKREQARLLEEREQTNFMHLESLFIRDDAIPSYRFGHDSH